MTLDNISKKLIQKEIEHSLVGIASSMTLARQSDFKESFRIENDGDFAIGWAIGKIIRVAQLDIAQRYERQPTSDEDQEITDAIWQKVDDFRNAVSKWK